jgi:hypothetical protein
MDSSEVVVTKRHIQELYTQMAYAFHDNMFFNFGVWNEKLHQEYIGLNFDFSKLYDEQDVYIISMVQASIYQRLIIKESIISAYAAQMLGNKLKEELPALIYLCGLAFLPWWKIRLKNPELRELVKLARKISFWSNKNYFYYLIQKIA